MTQMVWWISRFCLFAMGTMTTPVLAQELVDPTPEEQSRNSASAETVDHSKTQQAGRHYGGFVDLGNSLNFTENHLFRNRGTTPRVNELDVNMAGAYIRKDVSEQSRWGTKLLVQGGQGAKDYGFGVNLPKVQGTMFRFSVRIDTQ